MEVELLERAVKCARLAPRPSIDNNSWVRQLIQRLDELAERLDALTENIDAQVDRHLRIMRARITDLASEVDQLVPRRHTEVAEVVGRPKIAEIKAVACRVFNLTEAELIGPSRQAAIFRARMVAIHCCKIHTLASLPMIGRFFGNRDHTTILNSLQRFNDAALEDAHLAIEVLEIEHGLGINLVEPDRSACCPAQGPAADVT